MEIQIVLLIAILVLTIAAVMLLVRNSSTRLKKEIKSAGVQLRDGIRTVGSMVTDEARRNRADTQTGFRDNREEIRQSMSELNAMVTQTLQVLSQHQRQEIQDMNTQINALVQSWTDAQAASRQEQNESLRSFEETFSSSITATHTQQQEYFTRLLEEERGQDERQRNILSELTRSIDARLDRIQQENRAKLNEMESLVNEKLQQTVEKRFNESFQLISDRLEQVHKGLGEMQTLASGVGDLRRVLTNVKTRGNIGEIQLGSILEDVLSPEQYERNAHPVPNSREVVEYAIRLPGHDDSAPLLLPVDSKFPVEDYQRLLNGMESGADTKTVETLGRAFESAVRKNARDIQKKYIHAPHTTDFALMFVPTEGLYAEILRRPGLFESLQRDNHVTVVGPANLSAFLSSLQMGFRTLAIEKRTSEVWALLGTVKREFGDFGNILDKTKAQLERTVQSIEAAGRKTRTIQKKLDDVQTLPQHATSIVEEDA